MDDIDLRPRRQRPGSSEELAALRERFQTATREERREWIVADACLRYPKPDCPAIVEDVDGAFWDRICEEIANLKRGEFLTYELGG